MFTYQATVDGQQVELKFKDYGDAPGKISRRNMNLIEAQVWAYLEWGLVEPEHWPADDPNAPGSNVFDEMPQKQITECYQQWQAKE